MVENSGADSQPKLSGQDKAVMLTSNDALVTKV